MKKLIVSLVVSCFFISTANAEQRSPIPKPKSSQPVVTQPKQMKEQAKGNYPEMVRPNAAPIGAMNNTWSKHCAPNDSVQNFIYSGEEEIRFRVRQLVGTLVKFPEPVTPMVKGNGTADSVPYGAEGIKKATFWKFSVKTAGADSNYVFLGSMTSNGPRLYSLRIWTETFNAKECPDLIVNIHGDTGIDEAVVSQLQGTKQQTHKTTRGVTKTKVQNDIIGAVSKNDQTGRQKVDWLAGEAFSKAGLNFDWKMFGEKDLAPDIVYSDGSFMYLQYKKGRLKKLDLPSFSRVAHLKGGKVDQPVNWEREGNTIVVHDIAPLTLEIGDRVVCIRPTFELSEASAPKQWNNDLEPNQSKSEVSGSKGPSQNTRPRYDDSRGG